MTVALRHPHGPPQTPGYMTRTIGKVKPVETYGEDRPCGLCGCRLSKYNPLSVCGLCTRRERA
jgi:hypothetical protein